MAVPVAYAVPAPASAPAAPVQQPSAESDARALATLAEMGFPSGLQRIMLASRDAFLMRLWVVDNSKRPVGMVSLTMIIECIMDAHASRKEFLA